MTSATLTDLRHDASVLLYQMPEGVLASMIALMKEFAGRAGSIAPTAEAALPVQRQKPKRKFGVAAGKFVCPDDIDVDNGVIAEMFGVAE